MPADVTVLRGDTARPGPQRGLVHTLLGQLLALTLGASSLPSLGCRFLLPTVRMKTPPGMFLRTTWDHLLHSWFSLDIKYLTYSWAA